MADKKELRNYKPASALSKGSKNDVQENLQNINCEIIYSKETVF